WLGEKCDVARMIVRVLLPVLADDEPEGQRCLLRRPDVNADRRGDVSAARRILRRAGRTSLRVQARLGTEQRDTTSDDGQCAGLPHPHARAPERGDDVFATCVPRFWLIALTSADPCPGRDGANVLAEPCESRRRG